MKIRGRVVAVLGVISAILLLSACTAVAVPNESKVEKDVEGVLNNNYSSSETIETVEIVKRKTEKNIKSDTVWCKVETNDEEALYVRYFTLYYQLYDKGGWILENWEEDQTDKWGSTPLVGVNVDTIRNSLIGVSADIDGELWEIEPDNIGNLAIDEQETNLEQKRDVILATVDIKSDVLVAQGKLRIDYVYDEGWYLSNYNIDTPFATSYQANAELKMTDDILISEITKKAMIFDEGSTEQIINITSDEISEFKADKGIVQERGTVQIFNCSFILDKKVAVLSVEAKVIYQYGSVSNWSISDIIFSPKVVSVDMKGEWVGEYTYNRGYKLVLNVSEVAGDGTITSTFHFSGLPVNPSGSSGSYKLAGGIDFKELKIYLEGKEWISGEGQEVSMDKMYGTIYIQEEKIVMSIGGNKFDMVR